MRKQNNAHQKPKREKMRRMLSVIASVLLPPVGIFLTWRDRRPMGEKYALTALALCCMMLMVALLPSADYRVNGGIELVGREREAKIYGPDAPTSTVVSYVAQPDQPVLANDDEDEDVTYVYATMSGKYYHLEECTKYTYDGAQKLTVYEAHYHGYQPCTACNAPAYVEGSMN